MGHIAQTPHLKALVNSVALAALRGWLSEPGSDVEKKLSKAMRARHSELNHVSRREISTRVLGVAVLRGRLAHLLEREVGAEKREDAELLLRLFVARELESLSKELGYDHQPLDSYELEPAETGNLDVESAAMASAIETAARAPLFETSEEPSDAVRLAATWSLPLWVAGRWVDELGAECAFALGKAMCSPARITLRVNTLRTSRAEMLQALAEKGVRALPTSESPWGIWLPDGRPPGGGVWALPGWDEGLFEVQDEGSQLIALATEAKPGEKVVDYCAGRGGKTWALASMVAPNGAVHAWDIDSELRLQLGGKRADRANAASLVHVLDRRPERDDCNASMADAVLVDAPCSSSGVLRRHPSQRWSLNEEDVDRLADIQLQVLQEAAALVRPGGRLVYATCSLFRAENRNVADAFTKLNEGEFELWPLDDSLTSHCHCRTLLPHEEGTDGFFMARWRRVGSCD